MLQLAVDHQGSVRLVNDTPIWPSPQDYGPPHQLATPWNMSQQVDDHTSQSNTYYPSNNQFPSQAMANQYNYPPPDGQPNSTPNPNAPLPPLNLPPIRSMENMPQGQTPQQQGQQGQQGTQAPMPPNVGQYYPPGQPYSPPSDPNAAQRWPLPPDGRVMSGGRHKKEIKRRTKTGCLTCRKRRIKCDEAHPACRNCQKSKRDCLGYDPIFKSQPGPTNIQPAVSGAPPPQLGSATSSPYLPIPQGYPHAGSQPYGQAGVRPENSTTEPYDYGAAIDPALEGGSTARMQDNGFAPDESSGSAQGHRAKRTKIGELLCLRGYSPPPPPPAAPSQIPVGTREEIKHIWITVYAPGIDKFLETRWFALRGLIYLMENTRLCDQFAVLLNRFTMVPVPTDPAQQTQYLITQSLEATVIWIMMNMCRQVVNTPKSETDGGGVDELDVKDGVHDAVKRLEIFEALVSGEYLDAKSAPQQAETSNGTALDNQLKGRERDFWRLVYKFLTIRDDEASAAKEIDDTLASCRSLLDSRENRDVIYSIMIIRHVGARIAEFPNNLQQPESNDEADNKNKLAVAKTFIEQECEKGTNQVVQRLCGMAARSWVVKR